MFIRLPLVLSVLCVPVCAATAAAQASRPTTVAVRTPAAPDIDGKLDEPQWQRAQPATGFTQRDPDDGALAVQETRVRVLFDDNAIYIGATLQDDGPIRFRLGRRDMTLPASDWFRVSFDTFHDRRNAVRFDVNPAGVRRDAVLNGNYLNGGYTGQDGELAWEPVWEARTVRTEAGWTAELRIPLGQLRYTPGEDEWGVQFERIDDSNQELDQHAYMPKAGVSGVSQFGTLTNLSSLPGGRRLEFLPFVLSEGRFEGSGRNALTASKSNDWQVGGDARYGITPNLTLTATANPDFGQVEVDPAVINLTAFETRLDEKRPFFTEGSNAFRFAPSSIGPFTAKELFYPRRIGRVPQLTLPFPVTGPLGPTDILSAAKVTGRTASGWTLGVLDGVTREMRGRYLDGDGIAREALVEPRTNYFVSRVSRDARDGQTVVGGLLTAVNRDYHDPAASSRLVGSSYTGGFDFNYEFAGRVWNFATYLVGSRQDGTADAIAASQRSSARFYQRPDARTFTFDPTRTSLSGSAGQFQLTKQSGEHWQLDGGYMFVTPGYEINDLGFQQRVDRRGAFGRLVYNERRPGRVLRNWNVITLPELVKNFDGDWLERNIRIQSTLQHLSFWSVELEGAYQAERMDDRLTRGGPVALRPAGWDYQIQINADPRRRINGNISMTRRGDSAGMRVDDVTASVDFRHATRWDLSLGPRFLHTRQPVQFVSSITDELAVNTFGRRHVFAPLDQTEASLVARFNYGFSPDLTLELYTQTLFSHGDYGVPKEFLAPREYAFATYGTDIGTVLHDGAAYVIDPDGAGDAAPFTVPDRTFSTRSFRANAVLRWEFRRGSTLYVVWQQERLNPELDDDYSIGNGFGRLFEGSARNVLAVKMTYWINP